MNQNLPSDLERGKPPKQWYAGCWSVAFWGLVVVTLSAFAAVKWGTPTGRTLMAVGWLAVWLWFTYRTRVSIGARLVGSIGSMCLICCVAVVWPIYMASRPVSAVTQVRSNLKQIGMAIAAYVSDFDDRYPPASTWMDCVTPYGIDREPSILCDELLGCKGPSGAVIGIGFAADLSAKEKGSVDPAIPLVFELPGGRRNASAPADKIPSVFEGRTLERVDQSGALVTRLKA